MEVSKIHLSSTEMELMQNAEIILTKNRVLEKIKLLLEEVQHHQTEFVRENNLEGSEIFKATPKISRGENYLGLPYLVLDYPRQSSEDTFFFIRTMFWWGNFFSCTLHFAKDSKKIFEEKIKQSYPVLKNCYINMSDDQWTHHLQTTDYCEIGSMTNEEFKEACEKFHHIKIAGRHSLSKFGKLPSDLFENWKIYLSVCGLIS